jgi:hypothetical protein
MNNQGPFVRGLRIGLFRYGHGYIDWVNNGQFGRKHKKKQDIQDRVQKCARADASNGKVVWLDSSSSIFESHLECVLRSARRDHLPTTMLGKFFRCFCIFGLHTNAPNDRSPPWPSRVASRSAKPSLFGIDPFSRAPRDVSCQVGRKRTPPNGWSNLPRLWKLPPLH